MNSRTKLIGTIALGAALLVPVAQAQSPDDRAGLRGPGGIAAQQAGGAANHADNRAVPGPGATKQYDWRDYVFSYGEGIAAVSTDVAVRPDDRSDLRGPGAFTEGGVVQKTDSSGFDWGDAMIGSLGGLGAALLLTGGFFLLASQRNKTRLA